MVSKINELILYLKRRRKLSGSEFNKINLGCGMTVCEGWANIDGSPNALVSKLPKKIMRWFYNYSGAKKTFCKNQYVEILHNHIFVHHDLRFGIPLNSSSVEYIFTSHFLEHLYRSDMRKLLADCYRVLVPGGKIRISVPDLAYAINLYPKDKEKMLEKYFFINHFGNDFSNHKYMYDYDIIRDLLIDIGFDEVNRSSFQSQDFPDTDKLDNRPDDSLFVVAIK